MRVDDNVGSGREASARQHAHHLREGVLRTCAGAPG